MQIWRLQQEQQQQKQEEERWQRHRLTCWPHLQLLATLCCCLMWRGSFILHFMSTPFQAAHAAYAWWVFAVQRDLFWTRDFNIPQNVLIMDITWFCSSINFDQQYFHKNNFHRRAHLTSHRYASNFHCCCRLREKYKNVWVKIVAG